MKLYLLVTCSLILAVSLHCLGQTTPWTEQDYSRVADKLSSDLLNSQKLRDYIKGLGKKPNVSIGLIRSETNNTVDLNELIRKFEYKIFNSNMVEIVESADFRDEVRKERANQSEFETEQAFKKWGKEAGANLILFGDLSVKTETRGDKNYYYYTVSLFMTDIETNTRIWFGQEQVKKSQRIQDVEPAKFDPRLSQIPTPVAPEPKKPRSAQKYIGLDFNSIHPVIFNNIKPGLGLSLFKERSIGTSIVFFGWSFEYYQFGSTSGSLGSGSFNSLDPQSQFYGANNYTSNFSNNDKLYSVRPYFNFKVSGRKISFYTALEAGLALFSQKSKTQINIVSQSTNNKTTIENQKTSSSVTLIYGFKMGLGYRITPRLDLAASAGFTFGFVPPLQTISPSIYNSGSSVSTTWDRDLSFLYAYALAARLSYRVK